MESLTGEMQSGKRSGSQMDISQGDVLKIEGIKCPVFIASKDFFNQSGEIIGCPLYSKSSPGPLHIYVTGTDIQGFVHCEKLKLFDLNIRGYHKIGRVQINDIMNVADAIQGIFDYI